MPRSGLHPWVNTGLVRVCVNVSYRPLCEQRMRNITPARTEAVAVWSRDTELRFSTVLRAACRTLTHLYFGAFNVSLLFFPPNHFGPICALEANESLLNVLNYMTAHVYLLFRLYKAVKFKFQQIVKKSGCLSYSFFGEENKSFSYLCINRLDGKCTLKHLIRLFIDYWTMSITFMIITLLNDYNLIYGCFF